MSEQELSLEEIEEKLYQEGLLVCHFDDSPLESNARMYPHEGGTKIRGYESRQWIYFHCPKCGYDWALWKLLKR